MNKENQLGRSALKTILLWGALLLPGVGWAQEFRLITIHRTALLFSNKRWVTLNASSPPQVVLATDKIRFKEGDRQASVVIVRIEKGNNPVRCYPVSYRTDIFTPDRIIAASQTQVKSRFEAGLALAIAKIFTPHSNLRDHASLDQIERTGAVRGEGHTVSLLYPFEDQTIYLDRIYFRWRDLSSENPVFRYTLAIFDSSYRGSFVVDSITTTDTTCKPEKSLLGRMQPGRAYGWAVWPQGGEPPQKKRKFMVDSVGFVPPPLPITPGAAIVKAYRFEAQGHLEKAFLILNKAARKWPANQSIALYRESFLSRFPIKA